MSINNHQLLRAISDNNLTKLRALLETQTARTGTPEVAVYLLSRHPIQAEYSQHVVAPHPILNSTQYLARESARNGNAPLFRYLLTQYPSLLSTINNNSRNVESVLVNAMDGGLSIWKIILEHDARWKDYEVDFGIGLLLLLLRNLFDLYQLIHMAAPIC